MARCMWIVAAVLGCLPLLPARIILTSTPEIADGAFGSSNNIVVDDDINVLEIQEDDAEHDRPTIQYTEAAFDIEDSPNNIVVDDVSEIQDDDVDEPRAAVKKPNICMKVKAVFNNAYQNQTRTIWGQEPEEYINALFEIANQLYRDSSLDANVNLQLVNIEHVRNSSADDWTLSSCSKSLDVSEDVDYTVCFTGKKLYYANNFRVIVLGYAYLGTVCYESLQKRMTIVSMGDQSKQFWGVTLAHEIGHSLGMINLQGSTKTIMSATASYPPAATWSAKSKAKFYEFYNNEANLINGRFCVNTGCGKRLMTTTTTTTTTTTPPPTCRDTPGRRFEHNNQPQTCASMIKYMKDYICHEDTDASCIKTCGMCHCYVPNGPANMTCLGIKPEPK